MSSFVQGNTAVSTGATSGTVTLGSAPGSGHLLVIFVSAQSAVSPPTDSQGNTWTLATGTFNSDFQAYYATSNGAAGAYTATANWASAAGDKFLAIGEWVPPASFALDNAKYTQLTCSSAVTFTAATAGELAVLFSEVSAGGGTAILTGTGVVQRETGSASIFVMGDKLSTASGSNLWNAGEGGCCCGGDFYTAALVFGTPSSAPPTSVIFNTMNE
jgi:hypothetical protein